MWVFLVTGISTSPEHYLQTLCLLLPPSVTDVEDRDAEEVKNNNNNILKAQTVAATLMQPCLARNTLLYHLLYKYTAFFFKRRDPML